MRLLVESTEVFVDARGLKCRVWREVDASKPVLLMVALVAVPEVRDSAVVEAERELLDAPLGCITDVDVRRAVGGS